MTRRNYDRSDRCIRAFSERRTKAKSGLRVGHETRRKEDDPLVTVADSAIQRLVSDNIT